MVGGLALGVLVAALVAVRSVGDTGGDTAAGQVRFADLRVGDCLRAVDYGAQATTVDVAPCGDPHAAQVFATFELDGGTYPGAAETARVADVGCTQRLQDVNGIPDVDLYDVITFTPTEASWADGDRLVQCLLARKGGDPITGSLLEGDGP